MSSQRVLEGIFEMTGGYSQLLGRFGDDSWRLSGCEPHAETRGRIQGGADRLQLGRKRRGKYPITRSNGFAHPGKAEGPLVCRMIVATVPILVHRTLVTSSSSLGFEVGIYYFNSTIVFRFRI